MAHISLKRKALRTRLSHALVQLRPTLACAFGLALSVAVPLEAEDSPAPHTEVSIVRLWTDFRPTESFVRLGEYLTGDEKDGGEPILRSDPAHRSGHYWMVRLDNQGAPFQARPVLKVISADRPEVQTFDHLGTVSVGKGQGVLHFGLTHDLWRQKEFVPVAWEWLLLDEQGRTVARQASFLW